MIKMPKECVTWSYYWSPIIDDLEWYNPIDFGENGKPQWPPTAILWKYDEKACATDVAQVHNLIKNAPINFIFDIATDIL